MEEELEQDLVGHVAERTSLRTVRKEKVKEIKEKAVKVKAKVKERKVERKVAKEKEKEKEVRKVKEKVRSLVLMVFRRKTSNHGQMEIGRSNIMEKAMRVGMEIVGCGRRMQIGRWEVGQEKTHPGE